MKILLFTAFVLLSLPCFSQQVNPAPTLDREAYLKKSKSQKKAAWILLGAGVAVLTVSFVITTNQIEADPLGYFTTDNADGAAIVGLVGLASALTSIPLFIASGKNRRRAAALSFKMEKSGMRQQLAVSGKAYPAIAFRFHL